MPVINGLTLTLSDRVHETTQTTGTGTYSLDGAATGKRTFVAGIGSGNRTSYVAALGANWEVGVGTVTTGAPATLSRDSITASSNSNNAVSWAAGVKDIFCDVSAALANQIGTSTVLPLTRAPVAATGTAPQYLTINSAARVLFFSFMGISSSGTSPWLVQIGDSGGFETTGYASGVGEFQTANVATGFRVMSGQIGAMTFFGNMTLVKADAGSAQYLTASGAILSSAGGSFAIAGAKQLSGILDRIRLTTDGGTDTFDLGFIGLTEF